MKIVHLITRRQRRGAEVFAGQLSDGLARRGHTVALAGLYDPPPDPLVPARAQAHDVGGAPRPLDLGLACRLARYLAEIQPDLVQANGSDTLKYGVLARWWSGGTWPLVYRNISVMSRWLRLPLHRLWVTALLHQADHVAAVSHRSRQDLMDTFWLPEERVTTIPIGTEVEPVYPTGAARAHLAALGGASPDAPLLLHVGSYAPEKNHAWMLRAFKRIRRHVPEAQLFLAGDGPLRPEAERQIRREGLAESVHVLGSRGDVPRLMAGADLLLLPSLVEGIPGVILEAAVQGVPVVANDVGSISEAVEDGVAGRLVPLDDTDAFCAAVVDLLGNTGERNRLGEGARAFVAKRYALGAVINRFECLYARLTSAQSVHSRSLP